MNIPDENVELIRANLAQIEQLARRSYDLLSAPPPAADITVPAGGDVQAALNAAQPGQTVVLTAGANYPGEFRLPVKPAGPDITVRSSVTLPDRLIGVADWDRLAILSTRNSMPALAAGPGTANWRFDGIALVCGTSSGPIVALGNSDVSLLTTMPTGFTFDRCLVMAEETAKNGIEANCANFAMRRSSVVGVKLRSTGVETHAVVAWNGPGPFLIEDNYLEAGSCGFFVGGARPSIEGLIPSDIVFRRNYVTRPLLLHAETGWGIKNLFELKNAQRVHAYGNVFENNWVDAQHGYAIVLTVRANSATAPWSTVRDVLFEHNTIRHTAAAFNILGLDDMNPSTRMRNVTIQNNLVYDMDRITWESPTGKLGGGVFVAINGAPEHLTIQDNTATGAVTGNIMSMSGPALADFVFRRNAVQKLMTPYQTYGVKGDNVNEGNPTLARYCVSPVFADNILAGCTRTTYSDHPHNTFPTAAALQADFVDPANGNYRLKTMVGGVNMDALEAAQKP